MDPKEQWEEICRQNGEGSDFPDESVVWVQSELARLRADNERLKAAIKAAFSPDETKGLFMGECGIPWTTFKEVQRAILEQLRLNMGWRCSGCGSTRHILSLRDAGHISCCPERRLVPPTATNHGPASAGPDA